MFYKYLADYYEHVFPAPPKAAFLSQHFKPSDQLLDIGCSDGRVAHALATKGYHVTGIDLSEDMVRVASKVSENGTLFKVHLLNMLKIKDLFSEPFDGIYCLGNTLVHLSGEEEILDALEKCYATLKSSGILIIQILNYDAIFKNNITQLPLIDNDVLSFKRQYVLKDKAVTFKIALTIKDMGETYESSTTLYPIRKNRLEALLTQANFSKITCYGDYKGKPFEEDDLTLILCAQKG